MARELSFFDFAAEVGLTKHIGGTEATGELAALCRVGAASHVLDVGCGVGVTPCLLAKRYGCHVVGVDISERMVQRSRERAVREGVVGTVEFRVADAQYLPFDDAAFDAVITESVTSFPKDKKRAVSEYARVVRCGGCVGLSESVWLKTPPPPEVVAWASQDVGANVQPLTADDWVALLQGAGLQELVQQVFAIDAEAEAKGILRRYGRGGTLGILWRMLLLYARNPAYRRFVQRTRASGVLPPNLQEYFGYGLFVGRKPGG